MSEFAGPVSPNRATILVGYGAFGLTLQRRLLSSAAPRGVLTWQEPRGTASDERRLQDLALLWVPDRKIDPNDDASQGRNALEMMRDLHLQIGQAGDGSPPDAETFADALSEAAEQLLSVAVRTGRRDALPLGLDVIVVAQP